MYYNSSNNSNTSSNTNNISNISNVSNTSNNQKQQNLLKLEKDLQSLLSNKPIEELILINLNKEDFIEKFLEPVKKANLNIVNITSQTLGKFLLNYIIRE